MYIFITYFFNVEIFGHYWLKLQTRDRLVSIKLKRQFCTLSTTETTHKLLFLIQSKLKSVVKSYGTFKLSIDTIIMFYSTVESVLISQRFYHRQVLWVLYRLVYQTILKNMIQIQLWHTFGLFRAQFFNTYHVLLDE